MRSHWLKRWAGGRKPSEFWAAAAIENVGSLCHWTVLRRRCLRRTAWAAWAAWSLRTCTQIDIALPQNPDSQTSNQPDNLRPDQTQAIPSNSQKPNALMQVNLVMHAHRSQPSIRTCAHMRSMPRMRVHTHACMVHVSAWSACTGVSKHTLKHVCGPARRPQASSHHDACMRHDTCKHASVCAHMYARIHTPEPMRTRLHQLHPMCRI